MFLNKKTSTVIFIAIAFIISLIVILSFFQLFLPAKSSSASQPKTNELYQVYGAELPSANPVLTELPSDDIPLTDGKVKTGSDLAHDFYQLAGAIGILIVYVLISLRLHAHDRYKW